MNFNWTRILRDSALPWAAADQVLVSGVGFGTTVLLARWLGVDRFGLFGFAWAVMMFASAIQNAAISAPMLSSASRRREDQIQEFIQGVFSLQCLTAPLLGALIVGGAMVVSVWVESLLPLRDLKVELFLASALYQMQDWLRRAFFSAHESRRAFENDIISYGGQLLILVAFLFANALDVRSALLAISISSGAALAIGMIQQNLRFRFAALKSVVKPLWADGKHLLLAGQVHWLASQGALLLSADWLGTAGAGAVRAIQNLLGVFNVVLAGLDNAIPPTASITFERGGVVRLRSYLTRVALFTVIPFLIASALLVTNRRWIIRSIYGGEYEKYSYLVLWGVAFVLLALFVRLLTYYHRALSSTVEISRAAVLGSVSATLIVVIFITRMREATLFLSAIVSQSMMIIWLLRTARSPKRT